MPFSLTDTEGIAILESAKFYLLVGNFLPTNRQLFCPNKKPFHHIQIEYDRKEDLYGEHRKSDFSKP